MAVEQAAENFGDEYKATDINSSIVVACDSSSSLYIQEFVNNGTDFRATLAGFMGLGLADPSIRLYPTQLVEGVCCSSEQAFRTVSRDMIEMADNRVPLGLDSRIA